MVSKLILFVAVLGAVALAVVLGFFATNTKPCDVPKVNLGVNVAYTVATIGVLIAAVFASQIAAILKVPRLEIKLRSNTGQSVQINSKPTYYYHVRVTNKSWFPADNVRLRLKQVLIDGETENYLTGGPEWLLWDRKRDRELPNIGPRSDDQFDFFRISENDGITFRVLEPTTLKAINRPLKMQVYLIADSCSGGIWKAQINVDWDGTWADTPEMMVNHLKFPKN
jgi:hypothetical protein